MNILRFPYESHIELEPNPLSTLTESEISSSLIFHSRKYETPHFFKPREHKTGNR